MNFRPNKFFKLLPSWIRKKCIRILKALMLILVQTRFIPMVSSIIINTNRFPQHHGLWFHLRCFQPGDEKHWEQLVLLSFDRERSFHEEIGSQPYFQTERVIFIFFGETPVATATAWFQAEFGEEVGYLHMVGAHPDYSGWGLGYAVSLAALLQMRADGKLKSVLETDDFRLPAIKTYLKLAFQPVEHMKAINQDGA
jgi:mycothiol synthase